MPQLVFVHGVATRASKSYSREVENRNSLFRNIAFEGTSVDIHSPVWGDLVPKIDPKVFETDKKVASFSIAVPGLSQPLGTGSGGIGAGAAGSAGIHVSISELVKRGNANAILDAILTEIVEDAERRNRNLTDEEIDVFRKAMEAIASNESGNLLKGIASSGDITKRLTVGSYGLVDFVGSAVTKVVDRVRNTASNIGYGVIRDSLNPLVGLFIGDVFSYLKQNSVRNQIRARIGETIKAAHSESVAGSGPLIVVGHSLGGVILADMLQDPEGAGLPPDISVSQLVTVGSQAGLFQSLQVLSAKVTSNGKATRPACVRNWLNVFDPIDPLAFRADVAFDGVSDLAFDSVTGLFSAHSTYFKRPQFYARFRKRLQDEKLI